MILVLTNYLKPDDYKKYYKNFQNWDIEGLNAEDLDVIEFSWFGETPSAITASNGKFLLENLPNHCIYEEEKSLRQVYFVHNKETINNLRNFLKENKILNEQKYQECKNKNIQFLTQEYIKKIKYYLEKVLKNIINEEAKCYDDDKVYEKLATELLHASVYKNLAIQKAILELTINEDYTTEEKAVIFKIHTPDRILYPETIDALKVAINQVLSKITEVDD